MLRGGPGLTGWATTCSASASGFSPAMAERCPDSSPVFGSDVRTGSEPWSSPTAQQVPSRWAWLVSWSLPSWTPSPQWLWSGHLPGRGRTWTAFSAAGGPRERRSSSKCVTTSCGRESPVGCPSPTPGSCALMVTVSGRLSGAKAASCSRSPVARVGSFSGCTSRPTPSPGPRPRSRTCSTERVAGSQVALLALDRRRDLGACALDLWTRQPRATHLEGAHHGVHRRPAGGSLAELGDDLRLGSPPHHEGVERADHN